MARKAYPSDFGKRLAELRRQRGLTQVQLAEAIDSTQRAISYYENHTGYPPAPVVAQLAQALEVSTDELLGLRSSRRARAARQNDNPEVRRMWKKFQQLLTLPEKDRRAVMRLVNSLVGTKSE
jgi:transcriptional regulator with XRE-family HTH domain